MHIPGAHVLSYYFRRLCERQRARYSAKHQLVGNWHLLYGAIERGALTSVDPATLRKLIAPPDRYWADPFGWKRDGHFFVFCEEVMYGEARGHISVVPLNTETGLAGPSQPVVQEPHHLSYPFLFEFEGVLYMLPESGFANVLNLYRCEEFPYRWEKVGPIFEGVQYYDPTLLHHEDRWWLFVTKRDPRRLQLPDHDLFVFWSDSPVGGQWKPHPANPVVRDFRRARRAAAFFRLTISFIVRPKTRFCVTVLRST